VKVPPTSTPRSESLFAAASASGRWFARHWPWLLVLAVVPLFVSSAAYHAPLAVMVVLGFILLKRESWWIGGDPGFHLIVVFFLAFWIPQLIALPGAADPLLSYRTAARYLLYPVAGVFILHAFREERRHEYLALGVAAVVSIWSFDHLVGPAGLDLFDGREPDAAYWGGVFVGEHTVPHVAAAVSPLVFELVRRRGRAAPWVWIGAALLVLFVLISGRRVAWMMLFVAAAGYVALVALRAGRPRWRRGAGILALLAGALLLVYSQHDLTRERIHVTVDLLSAERAEVDLGTSYRLDIWTTTLRSARDNWPFGVGALGSRHVYADYAAPDDHWVLGGLPNQHPHQFLLEVAADTGLAGLLGYLLAWAALVLALTRTRSAWARACGVALGVAIFPLNAHMQFYSSYWAMLTWWLVGLTAGALSSQSSQDRAVVGAGPDGRDREVGSANAS
jgi:O-antigen ligase